MTDKIKLLKKSPKLAFVLAYILKFKLKSNNEYWANSALSDIIFLVYQNPITFQWFIISNIPTLYLLLKW